MSRFNKKSIRKIEAEFAKNTLCADKVMIAKLDKDFESVIEYFEISPENINKLEQVRTYLKRNWVRGSIELSDVLSEQRITLAFLPVSSQRMLIWRKTESIKKAEEWESYGIKGIHFNTAQEILTDLTKSRINDELYKFFGTVIKWEKSIISSFLLIIMSVLISTVILGNSLVTFGVFVSTVFVILLVLFIFKESMKKRINMLSKVGYFTVGFLMIFELVMLFNLVLKTTGRS